MNFQLKEFASIPADDRNKIHFWRLLEVANVHIFEAIKKEPDARVVEISGMVSWEKPSPFKGKSRFLL